MDEQRVCMNKRVVTITGILIGLAVVIGAVWWLASPLFINRTIDEGFPNAAELAANPDMLMEMSEEDRVQVQGEVLDSAANNLSDLFPEASEWSDAARVIDFADPENKKQFYLYANAVEQIGMLYLERKNKIINNNVLRG